MDTYITREEIHIPSVEEFESVVSQSNQTINFKDLPTDRILFVFGAQVREFDTVYLVCLNWKKVPANELQNAFNLMKYNNSAYHLYVKATPHFSRFMLDAGYLKNKEASLPMGYLKYYGPIPMKTKTHDFLKYSYMTLKEYRECEYSLLEKDGSF